MSEGSQDLQSDVVFLRGLALTATLGADAWHREGRPQPVIVDVRMRTNIEVAGNKDDVLHTIHYGHLCKAITKEIDGKHFEDISKLAYEVCSAAFRPNGGRNKAELTVSLPKGCLLAESVGISTVQVQIPTTDDSIQMRPQTAQSHTFFARGMKLPCIIGVNPYERLEKQYVVLDLTFSAIDDRISSDYPKVLKDISDFVETSSYETLEALATEVCRIACSHGLASAVTTSIQKPSALTFVAGSGVEITRTPEFFR